MTYLHIRHRQMDTSSQAFSHSDPVPPQPTPWVGGSLLKQTILASRIGSGEVKVGYKFQELDFAGQTTRGKPGQWRSQWAGLCQISGEESKATSSREPPLYLIIPGFGAQIVKCEDGRQNLTIAQGAAFEIV